MSKFLLTGLVLASITIAGAVGASAGEKPRPAADVFTYIQLNGN